MPQPKPLRRVFTQAQLGLWLSQQQAAQPALYNTAEYVCLDGPLDLPRFRRAAEQALQEAEGLHVVIDDSGDVPEQRRSLVSTALERVDVSADAKPEDAANAWMRERVARTVNFKTGPLVCHALIRLSAERHYWFLSIHHLLIDGYGYQLLQQRVAELYRTPEAPPAFGPPEAVFEEDAAYQASTARDADQAFWAEKLAGLATQTPRLSTRPPTASHQLLNARAHLEADEFEALKAQAESSDTHWTDWIYAASALLVHTYTGARDIPLGMAAMGRLGSKTARVPALVMNLSPLRVSLPAGATGAQLSRAVREELRDCRPHLRYRYGHLLRDSGYLAPERRLFALVVNVLPFDFSLDFGAVKARSRSVSSGGHDDLSVTVQPRGEGGRLQIDIGASPAVYQREAVEQFLATLLTVLRSLIKDPAQPQVEAAALPLLSGPPLAIPAEDVSQLLVSHAYATPEQIALIDGERQWSYRALLQAVLRRQSALRACGLDAGQRVALALPQGSDAIVAVLSVLGIGATYIPLDPNAPTARQTQVLKDAAPAALIVGDAEAVPDWQGPVWRWDCLDSPTQDTPAARYCSDTAAYQIYTSGSTGTPKGVIVSRRALAHFVASARQCYGLRADDRVLHFAPLHFDASVEEIFGALGSGATLVVRDGSATRCLATFTERLHTWGITVLDLPTAFWHEWSLALAQHKLSFPASLRQVIIGGEALYPEQRQLWFELPGACPLWNTYGPSEATVVATAQRLTGRRDPVSIGQPLPGVQAWVRNDSGEPCQPGTAGELMLCGPTLSSGYHNLSRQTAERFVKALPFVGAPRSYASGDLVRQETDGSLSYLGRVDDEIKISGHRVTPGEVEAALLALDDVQQAAVLGMQTGVGEKYLTAFLVTRRRLEAVELRRQLANKLPPPLIPSSYHQVTALPKTSTGKVDRQALQALARQHLSQAPDIGFESGTEAKVRQVWQTVLGLTEIERDADFFALGGQSLQCLQVANRLSKLLGKTVEIPLLFSHPRLKDLAQALDREADSKQAGWPLFVTEAQGPERVYRQPQGRLRAVLLTGATGFLGTELLTILLQETPIGIYCLVRADSERAGLERLKRAVQEQGGSWQPHWEERLHVVVGDVAKARLGLTQPQWQTLADAVDAVIANAAQVSVMRDYQSLRAANVDGTQHLLDLAAVGTAKRFQFISTLATLPSAELAPVAAPCAYAAHAGLQDGYQQSKWVAEQRVYGAIAQGLAAEVFRIGRITPASRGGNPNAQDLLWRIIGAGLKHRLLPALDFAEIWTPVDYVAHVIVRQLFEPLSADTWHLTPYPPVPIAEVYDWLRSSGYEFAITSLPEWLQCLTQGDQHDQTLAAFFEQRRNSTPAMPGRFEPPPFNPRWHSRLQPIAKPDRQRFQRSLAQAAMQGMIVQSGAVPEVGV
ncbi:non-ribosomal peptide synthetase [Alkalilimnicola ehrlichii]|uniref:non-ribosomal peptide synthetase n=1 Tax=Alkalilimnicola ehrlichii TaxID=351052 RepID=UPI0015F284A6|nr:non-ribosomal peptide synthetase [Alkalilimnicola ehrlichii]